jgi:hypothetical protein
MRPGAYRTKQKTTTKNRRIRRKNRKIGEIKWQ